MVKGYFSSLESSRRISDNMTDEDKTKKRKYGRDYYRRNHPMKNRSTYFHKVVKKDDNIEIYCPVKKIVYFIDKNCECKLACKECGEVIR